MKFLKLALILVLAIFSVKSVFAINIPKYSGRVNDFAKVFSPNFTSNLEQKILQIESQTTDQIAVVTVKNLQGTTIEDFAEQLFKSWGIGQKNKDNGILLLVSIDDRRVRIEVGYGLEAIITDGRAGEIIRNQITPEFKKGDYEAGVLAGVDKVSQYLTGQILEDSPKNNYSDTEAIGFFLLIIASIFASYLFAFMARTKSFYAGGIIGGILGFIIGNIITSTLIALMLSIIIGLIGLLLDFILSKNYNKLKKLRKNTGFWGSGGGFSGGGGGGFGGGSSGGGGASGGW